MAREVYLDYAAATPIDETVLAAMQPYFGTKFYNPSATYGLAREVSQDLADARAKVAALLGAKPAEITFVAGGSESNNLALHGAMRAAPAGSNLVISTIEHESVVVAAQRYDCRQASVDQHGIIDLDDLERQIDDQTALVSVMYANNEIGSVQPIRKIAQRVADIRARRQARGIKLPLLLHSDATQAANYLDLHVSRLGVDLMTLNGGKIYGPKQSGILYARVGTRLDSLVDGGGQEQGLRSGTENMAANVGFAAALELAGKIRKDETARLQQLQRQFIDGARKISPQIQLNGSTKQRLPNNVHLTFPGQDNERLLMELDQAGIQAAAGSACSASSEEPSTVLAALGLDEAAMHSSLRFTMGRQISQQDIDYTLKTLAKLLA